MTGQRTGEIRNAPNLRDVGGYPATGGSVRRGIAFRSDDLSALDAADLAAIAALGVRTVVDFRDTAETLARPDILPTGVVNRFSLPIGAGRLMGGEARIPLTASRAEGLMVSAYQIMINDFQPAFREFFRIISTPAYHPVLFHCTAGKDRTGVAAALLLAALGVAHETVMEDYLLSVDCLKSKYLPGIDYDETMEPLFIVKPEYLQAAFDAIENYGGVEAYLDGPLEADRSLLRKLYVESTPGEPTM